MPLPKNNPIDLDYLRSRDWWSKVDIRGDDECWPWRMSTGKHGYGQTWDGITVRLAHRVAFSLHHGRQIADDMTIDHRPDCLRICCNPAHLTEATNLENATGNQQGAKTHCPKGHPYSGANLKIYTNPRTGKTCRKCIQCQRDSNARRKT